MELSGTHIMKAVNDFIGRCSEEGSVSKNNNLHHSGLHIDSIRTFYSTRNVFYAQCVYLGTA